MDRKTCCSAGDCPYCLRGSQGSDTSHCQDHGDARGWGHPHLHHVTFQPFGLARGHNVWYYKWEERTSSLGGPSQRNDCGPQCAW